MITGAMEVIWSASRLLLLEFVGNGQLMTSLATTAGEYLAAIGRLHTLTETMH